MQTFWSFLGWGSVAAIGIGYLWFAYRFVLFPKVPKGSPKDESATRRVA